MIAVARSAARNSGSPEAPVVSQSMASAPASILRVGEVDHVEHRHLDGLFLGGARLGDAAPRQELVPVVAGTVGLGVEAQVGHDPVLQRRHGGKLRVVHVLGLVGEDGAHHLERVVADAELEQVGAHPLLVGLQVLDAGGVRLHAGAVAGQHDLVAHVDAGEARRRGVDVEQMIDLVGGKRRHLGPLGRRLGAGLQLGPDLAAGEPHEHAVGHARRHPPFTAHALPPPSSGLALRLRFRRPSCQNAGRRSRSRYPGRAPWPWCRRGGPRRDLRSRCRAT